MAYVVSGSSPENQAVLLGENAEIETVFQVGAVKPPVVVPEVCFAIETVRCAVTVVASSTFAVVVVGVTSAFVMHCTAQPVPAEMIGPDAVAVPASASAAQAAAAPDLMRVVMVIVVSS